MATRYHKLLIVFSLILSSSIFSYYIFVIYKPKILSSVEISQVRGAKTNKFNIVYPLGSKELGVSNTKDGRQIVIKVAKDPESVRNFYKNIFTLEGWKVIEEGNAGLFWTAKFKKEEALISVTASFDQSSSVSKESIVTITTSNDD